MNELFKLSRAQQKKYKEWKKDKKAAYVGAVGGSQSFTFTVTSLGVAVIAKMITETGSESIDLSEYENW